MLYWFSLEKQMILIVRVIEREGGGGVVGRGRRGRRSLTFFYEMIHFYSSVSIWRLK